ncbi:hypothetical protein [Vibrio mediterranei]|uniref:hypothetical protein n=1 Tax=Vibrio mediterranei TaxID=689 RepID=UPI0040689E2F
MYDQKTGKAVSNTSERDGYLYMLKIIDLNDFFSEAAEEFELGSKLHIDLPSSRFEGSEYFLEDWQKLNRFIISTCRRYQYTFDFNATFYVPGKPDKLLIEHALLYHAHQDEDQRTYATAKFIQYSRALYLAENGQITPTSIKPLIYLYGDFKAQLLLAVTQPHIVQGLTRSKDAKKGKFTYAPYYDEFIKPLINDYIKTRHQNNVTQEQLAQKIDEVLYENNLNIPTGRTVSISQVRKWINTHESSPDQID